MVLSTLFGKKKEPDKRRGKKVLFDDEPSSVPANPAPASTDKNPAYPDNAREMAKATARKIDQIESEMSREMAPGAKLKDAARSSANASQAGLNASSGATVTGSNRGMDMGEAQPVPKTTFMGMGTTTPSIGQSTDILLGDSVLSNAIELSDSINNPAIEEAAILFSYGQAASAAEVLRESLAEGQSNRANVQAWLMLLELYQVTSDKAHFESLSIDYALCFESSAPVWADGVNKPKLPPTIENASMPIMQALVVFDGVLDSSIVPHLDRLKRLTPKHHTLYIDFSSVTRVEGTGAELILRMLTAFGKSNHVLVVQGAEHLLSRAMVDLQGQPKSVWTLLLDLLRLLGRQEGFEEKSIEYCVAFEVSPPPWEPFAANIHVEQEAAVTMAATTIQAPTELPTNTIALKGEVLGKAENELSMLSESASKVSHINIDCSKLNRVDFTAAGALLNWAVSQQMNNKTVQFSKVSHLVGALFIVMGIHEVAEIERR